MLYISLHTRVDYYAEHEFFVHRIQHLVLHHLGPLLVMAAYPAVVIKAALPLRWRMAWRRARHTTVLRWTLRALFHPTVVTLVFIASVLVWVIPSVQFVSMLDWRLYRFMNWSVTLTGFAYWGMLLDHRPAPPARLAPGLRVLSPILTMSPQILAGAIITFSQRDMFPIFDICGRAFFGMPALIDQSLGGLIMWVPAALIEAVGGLMALRCWMRLSQNGRLQRRPRRQFAAPTSAAKPTSAPAGPGPAG